MLGTMNAGEKTARFGKEADADILFRAECHQRGREGFEAKADYVLDRVNRCLKDFFVIHFNDECFTFFREIRLIGCYVEGVEMFSHDFIVLFADRSEHGRRMLLRAPMLRLRPPNNGGPALRVSLNRNSWLIQFHHIRLQFPFVHRLRLANVFQRTLPALRQILGYRYVLARDDIMHGGNDLLRLFPKLIGQLNLHPAANAAIEERAAFHLRVQHFFQTQRLCAQLYLVADVMLRLPGFEFNRKNLLHPSC